jgi:hypothetical protein
MNSIGAKALLILQDLMYGLKPVLFKLKLVPFKLTHYREERQVGWGRGIGVY